MARPLFIKNSDTSWAQASDYNINNGSWTRGKLIYVKTDNGWEHEHEYQDQVQLAAATCQNGAKYQDDCPCGEAHGAPYYSGPVDPDNHTGVEVYGGTENSHTQYNCCGLITSAIHVYGNPSYNWSSSHTSCTASAICDCGYKITETSNAIQNSHYAGTCIDREKMDYKVYFSNSLFSSQVCPDWHYGSTDPTNHTGTASFTGYTKIKDYWNSHAVDYKYNCCGATYSESEPCNGEDERVITQPTCTEDGFTKYYCSKCGAETGYLNYPFATGHSFPQNYTDFGNGWHAKVCTVCGEYYDYHTIGNSSECNICNK